MDCYTESAIIAEITAAVATAIELLLDDEDEDDMVEEQEEHSSSRRRAEEEEQVDEEDDNEPAPRRKKRAKYKYADSKRYIKRDFLGPNPNVKFRGGLGASRGC